MSHSPEKREHRAFIRQVGQSRDRGIEFKFTFDEWRSWWIEQLGPSWMEKRGRTKGKFHMARKGDVGPYEPSNVKCITLEENSAERVHKNRGENCGTSRLTPDQVREIRRICVPYSLEFGGTALARKYGVAHGTVNLIVRGGSWRDPKYGWDGRGEPSYTPAQR